MKHSELKDENGKLETKISSLSQEVQSRTNEMNREIRRKERAEREVKQLKGDLEEKNKDIFNLKEDKVIIQVRAAQDLESTTARQQIFSCQGKRGQAREFAIRPKDGQRWPHEAVGGCQQHRQ